MRYPMEVNLVGDATETLRALLPLLEHKQDRSWREEIEAGVERWWKVLDEQAQIPADPINPQLVFHELSPRLPDRAILTADTGTTTDWWARHLKVREGMDAMVSGTLATMGPGIPYALGAKMAAPDRPVITVLGDGAMQMLGMNALIDIAKYAPGWADQRLVIMVLNNHDLNQVTWEQRVMSGDPKLDASQILPDVDYAGYARLLGLHGERVTDPTEVGPAWDRALAAGRPAVLDVVTDPEVPPLPPHVTFTQARDITHAIAHGDPAAPRFMKQSLRAKLAELLTR
jgi:pyruvate dehydrogenase (quinone)